MSYMIFLRKIERFLVEDLLFVMMVMWLLIRSLILICSIIFVVFFVFIVVVIFFCRYMRRKFFLNVLSEGKVVILEYFKGFCIFIYKEFRKVIRNFDEIMILGSGGFGVVYKGIFLLLGIVIVVKCFRYKLGLGEKVFVVEVFSVS